MSVPPLWRRRLRARLRRWPLLRWVAAAAAVALVVGPRVFPPQATGDFGALVEVPVATTDIAIGEVVTRASVRMERRPERTLPSADPAVDWNDRVALVALAAGEVVLSSRLAPGGVAGVAALLEPGERAIAVPPGPGGRPPITVGDRVDLLAAVVDPAAGGDGATVPAFVVAARARVVHVDHEDDVVTVAVPAVRATDVAAALATGTVTLVLTRPDPP